MNTIGICIGVMVTESTLQAIRFSIPAHIKVPKGDIATKLVKIKNKFWDEPMVVVGWCQHNPTECSCFSHTKDFIDIKEACLSQFRSLIKLVEGLEEERPEVMIWVGPFLEVADV